MNRKLVLEICAYTLSSALRAEAAGAHRIELCADAESGGVTPSAGTIAVARQHLKIPLVVMIRPRPGNFVYTDAEFTSMKEDIKFCRELGMSGVALGVLDESGGIDRNRTTALVQAALPMEVTFHRAFDLVHDPLRAVEDVIRSGCSRLLTSGTAPWATDGTAMIQRLVELSKGRLTVVVGSGVRSSNLAQLARETNAREFHSSARLAPTHPMPGGTQFGEPVEVDVDEVAAMRKLADSFDFSS